MNEIPPELQKYVEILSSHGGVWIYLSVTFFMIIEYVFPPFPGDIAIFSAGFIAGTGSASLTLVLIMAFIGSCIGLSVVYAVGQKYGRSLVEKNKIRYLNHTLLEKTEAWYSKVGEKLLLVSKFLPGVRFALVFFSGLANIPFRRAFTLTAISCLVWNTIVIIMGFYLQKNIQATLGYLSTYRLVVFIALIVIAVIWITIYILGRRRSA
jgi:membrane protein DedA with SNARE-associated domain